MEVSVVPVKPMGWDDVLMLIIVGLGIRLFIMGGTELVLVHWARKPKKKRGRRR